MANNNDIYTNGFADTRSITTSGALITWGIEGNGRSSSKVPLLMSGLQIAYGRSVAPLFPINLDNGGDHTRLNLVGSPSGTLACAGLLTPDAEDLTSFLKEVGKACVDKGSHVAIDVSPFSGTTCGSGAKITYHIRGLLLASLGLEITGGGGGGIVMVNMPLQFVFTSMEPIAGASAGS